MREQLKTLRHWMACYLHQDFDLEYDGTVDGALAGFINEEEGSVVESFRQELNYLIDNPIDDWDDLFYKQWFIGYYYQSEWPSALDWLRHLRDEINRLLSIK